MQRASRQRIALALIFCLVQSGMLSSAPRLTTRTPGQHEVLAAGWQFGSPVPRAPLGRPGAAVRSPTPLRRRPSRAPDAAGAQAQPCDAPANEIVAENCLQGSTGWDVTGAGSANIQGFATDISVNKGESVAFKIDTPSVNYRLDIYRMGYYGGWAPAKSRRSSRRRRCRRVQPRACATRRPASSTAATGAVSAHLGCPGERRLGHLLREAGSRGSAVGAPEEASHIVFIVRDDTRRIRSVVPDLGHDLAGVQRVRRRQQRWTSPTRHAAGRARQGELQPAVQDAAERPASRYAVRRRIPDGAVSRSERLRRQATSPASTAIGSAPNPGAQGLSLVGHDEYWSAGAARQRGSGAQCGCATSRSSAATKCSGRRGRRPASMARRTPYRTLVCYKETPRQRQDRSESRLDRHLARRRGSARRPTAAARRTPDRQHLLVNAAVPGTSAAMQVPPARGRTRFWRDTSSRDRGAARQHDDAAVRIPGVRVERRPGQRLAAGRPDAPVVDDGLGRRAAPGQWFDLRRPASPRTASRCTATPVARSCSVPAPLRGRGASTRITTADPPCRTRPRTRTCSRRRSICSRTWACSPPRCRRR